jgi:hypothetical protein
VNKRRYSGDVAVNIFDIDWDTYIAEVTTPDGARIEAASLDPDRPADVTARGLDEAAGYLISLAQEPDDPQGRPAPDIRVEEHAELDAEGWPIVRRKP